MVPYTGKLPGNPFQLSLVNSFGLFFGHNFTGHNKLPDSSYPDCRPGVKMPVIDIRTFLSNYPSLGISSFLVLFLYFFVCFTSSINNCCHANVVFALLTSKTFFDSIIGTDYRLRLSGTIIFSISKICFLYKTHFTVHRTTLNI